MGFGFTYYVIEFKQIVHNLGPISSKSGMFGISEEV